MKNTLKSNHNHTFKQVHVSGFMSPVYGIHNSK